MEGNSIIGKKIGVVGLGNCGKSSYIERAIIEAESHGVKVVTIDKGENIEEALKRAKESNEKGERTVVVMEDVDKTKNISDIDFNGVYNPYIEYTKLHDILPMSGYDNEPNKLQYLKRLNLSKEQIDFIKNSPLNRMDGETQEKYKHRRLLSKLIVKYRGQF